MWNLKRLLLFWIMSDMLLILWYVQIIYKMLSPTPIYQCFSRSISEYMTKMQFLWLFWVDTLWYLNFLIQNSLYLGGTGMQKLTENSKFKPKTRKILQLVYNLHEGSIHATGTGKIPIKFLLEVEINSSGSISSFA